MEKRMLGKTGEELTIVGGGFGLFVGCAAGDTGAAVVVQVTD